MNHSHLFLHPTHVKKNLGPKLGAAKAIELCLYEIALYVPTQEKLVEIKKQFHEKMKKDFNAFKDNVLLRCYRKLQDLTTTSQGAESQIKASI